MSLDVFLYLFQISKVDIKLWCVSTKWSTNVFYSGILKALSCIISFSFYLVNLYFNIKNKCVNFKERKQSKCHYLINLKLNKNKRKRLESLACKNGMIPSRAIACKSRGAPVRLCRPAPQQEKNEPITITQGEGHARTPITGVLFIDSPNLKHPKIHTFKQYWVYWSWQDWNS